MIILKEKMFLKINHQELDIYKISRALVKECYKITKSFPSDERFVLNSQIRRAALSVHLNIAEGCSRKSVIERKRYFEISRGSVIEIDAAFDIAGDLRYCSGKEMPDLEIHMNRTFSMLCKMIDK